MAEFVKTNADVYYWCIGYDQKHAALMVTEFSFGCYE